MSHSKDYQGMYLAEVMDVGDPEKRCRVRLYVYDVFDNVANDDLPWANSVLPAGSRPGERSITPLKAGDKVWAQFVGGDTRRPLILGCAQAAPEGKVNLAPEACQGEGQFEHKRGENQPQVDSPPYYEDVVVCQNHALIQLCRAGNIRVTQMDSGSAIEIAPSGDIIIHTEGKLFMSVEGETLLEYAGSVTEHFKSDLTTIIDGGWTLSANGGSTMTSDFKMDGNLRVSQNVDVGSNINAGGQVIDSGGNTNHHSH